MPQSFHRDLFEKGNFVSDRRFDVLGLGNAIVDVIAQTDEDFLERHSLRKGAMTLIDEGQAESFYSLMNPATIISGGSGKAEDKMKAMKDAGITVCATPAEIGEKVKSRL